MLSFIRFHYTVETQRLACRHFFLPRTKKHVAEFNMYIGKGTARVKHVAQTADQSAQSGPKGQLNEGQTKWRTLRFEWVFCPFVSRCYENSKLIAIAVGRNSLSSLSERESVTTQDAILSVRGKESKRRPLKDQA